MKRIIFIIIFIIARLTPVFAQAETTSFDVNGIKVIFKPTVKNMVSVKVYFRGGVTNYPAKQAGIEGLTLDALTECGTIKHSANEFKDIADYYNINLGATAEYDYCAMEMSCIYKYFNQGWDLFAEAINYPVFDKSELELLKNKAISDIKQSETSPDKHIEQLTLKNAFAGTVYATDPDGTEETVNALTADDLKSYYKTLLNKNKMFIVIAGRITKEEVIKKITAAFKDLPAKTYKPVVLTPPVWKDNKTFIEPRDLATNYINGVMNAPSMTNPDFMAYQLGISVFSGNLFSELRTNRNLSYDPGARTTNVRMPYATMYISTVSPAEAVSAMMEQLNEMKRSTVTPKGMEEIRSNFITTNYMKLQSSSAITGNLGNAEIMGGWQFFENAPARLDKVTPDQITNAIKKYVVGVRWTYLGDANLAAKADTAFKIPVEK